MNESEDVQIEPRNPQAPCVDTLSENLKGDAQPSPTGLPREFSWNGKRFSVLEVLEQWNRSILWAILAGILSWVYVIYFAMTRQADETPNENQTRTEDAGRSDEERGHAVVPRRTHSARSSSSVSSALDHITRT
jgi:hypothetical protein